MKRMNTLLLMAATMLVGPVAQAGSDTPIPGQIARIHEALLKAPNAPIQLGDTRYTLVNERYEECTSRRMARREGKYVKCVKPSKQGWSVVILTPLGTRSMEGGSLDAEGKVLHGHCAYYDPNGQLRAEGLYAHGLKTCTWSRYDASGHQLSNREYHGEDWDLMQVRLGLATMAPMHAGGIVIAEQ